MQSTSLHGEVIRQYLKRLQARAAAREKGRAQARRKLGLDDEESEFLGLKRPQKAPRLGDPF